MGIVVKEATGKAKCGKCAELITKGSVDVMSWAYQDEKHHHLACILAECSKEQVDKAVEEAMLRRI